MPLISILLILTEPCSFWKGKLIILTRCTGWIPVVGHFPWKQAGDAIQIKIGILMIMFLGALTMVEGKANEGDGKMWFQGTHDIR